MQAWIAILTSIVSLVSLFVHCLRDKAEFRKLRK